MINYIILYKALVLRIALYFQLLRWEYSYHGAWSCEHGLFTLGGKYLLMGLANHVFSNLCTGTALLACVEVHYHLGGWVQVQYYIVYG